MKIYVQNNCFKMAGKAKDIRFMLYKYRQYFTTVKELIEKNQCTYTEITPSINKVPKRMQYYLFFPSKK
ncbi:Z-ring formation inhibitor MciZ [Calidifontibacillus erzurumensis]|uniref:Z-ring formation inhibitor MciZ n=1 Tax=Calidifontibacillus erzurumensis TaxID=2741433 RepID=A0A8J8GDT7_9BACI|nr:Z-ring formation inhibitor MciZ [Calidifontibacillus erzurumensis]NSL50435.1 Z-ring formation inhibitor MciZ [Calidifontibacillus erzurumensis]